jgi:hypothetical protein
MRVALAQEQVEVCAERPGGLGDGYQGDLPHPLPGIGQQRMTILQERGQRPGSSQRRLVLTRRVAGLVEHAEFGERQPADGNRVNERHRIAILPPGCDRNTQKELAHLQAPVAEMNVGDHIVADLDQDPPQALADDERPEVADMQRLRDVGASIVDHRLQWRDLICPERGIGEHRSGFGRDRRIGQPEVHEAGAGDGDFLEDGVPGSIGDRGRKLARVLSRGLGEPHHVVALEIAELRLGGPDDGGDGIEAVQFI